MSKEGMANHFLHSKSFEVLTLMMYILPSLCRSMSMVMLPLSLSTRYIPRLMTMDREFNWSQREFWNRTGDPLKDVPSADWVGEIPESWTVWLDVITPMMFNLTVRGKLKYHPSPNGPIGIHANFIDIRGGSLEIGSRAHPYNSSHTAFIELHGDVKVYGKGEKGQGYCFGCIKKVDVRGTFSVHGRPRVVTRRFQEDAFPGATTIKLSTSSKLSASAGGASGGNSGDSGSIGVDWEAGDRLVLTATGGAHPMRAGAGGDGGGSRAQFATYPITDHQLSRKSYVRAEVR